MLQILNGIETNTVGIIEDKEPFLGNLFFDRNLSSIDLKPMQGNLMASIRFFLNDTVRKFAPQNAEQQQIKHNLLYLQQRASNLNSFLNALQTLSEKGAKAISGIFQSSFDGMAKDEDMLSGLEIADEQESLKILNPYHGTIFSTAPQTDFLGWFGKRLFNSVKSGIKKAGQGIARAARATGQGIARAARATGQGISNAAQAVKKAAIATGQAVAKAAVATAQAVKKGVTAAVKFIAKYNPLSILTRLGIITFMKFNVFNVGYKVGIGTLTDEQAKKIGVDKNTLEECRKVYHTTYKIFCNVLQGNEENLKNACQDGLKRKLKSMGKPQELGEPVTAATATTTAAAVLAKVISAAKSILPSLFGKSGDDTKGEDLENVGEQQVKEASAETGEKIVPVSEAVQQQGESLIQQGLVAVQQQGKGLLQQGAESVQQQGNSLLQQGAESVQQQGNSLLQQGAEAVQQQGEELIQQGAEAVQQHVQKVFPRQNNKQQKNGTVINVQPVQQDVTKQDNVQQGQQKKSSFIVPALIGAVAIVGILLLNKKTKKTA